MKSKLGSQIVVGVLIIVVAIAACNTPAPLSPTSTPVSIAQGPTIHIGSASMSPEKTMKVCAGETVALTTNAQGTDLTYAWYVDGAGQLKHPGGKGNMGSSNRYTAPLTTGQDVIKATAMDANNQSASDQVVITIVACPTPPEPTKTPTVTPTLTPAPCNPPTCIAIDSGGWNPEKDDKGSEISVSATPGQMDKAIRISYTLTPTGWVGVLRDIGSLSLAGTEKLVFFYKLTGATNTIELKLFYEKGAGTAPNSEPIFLFKFRDETDPSGWTRVEVPYNDIRCEWPDTGCTKGEPVDPSKVRKIGFAISFALGGTPGPGGITLDGVQAVQALTSAPSEPAASPVPTKSPSLTGKAPVIESPKDGEEVNMNITVSGSVAKTPMAAGTNLYVIVRPHGSNYWVQPFPGINDDGTWNANPVQLGWPADSGALFDIYAVVTDQQLKFNQELFALPPGPASRVTVTRQ